MTKREKETVLAGKTAALAVGERGRWAYAHLYGRQRRAFETLTATAIRQNSNNSRVEASALPIDLPALQEGPGLSGYRVQTEWGSTPWVGG